MIKTILLTLSPALVLFLAAILCKVYGDDLHIEDFPMEKQNTCFWFCLNGGVANIYVEYDGPLKDKTMCRCFNGEIGVIQ